MAKIDRAQALTMMLSGETDSRIAQRFGTSRQAVNLLRREFSKQGKLATPRASVSPPEQTLLPNTRPTPPTPSPQPSPVENTTAYPTFDQITDWLTAIIKQAAEAKDLRQQVEALNARVASLEAEAAQLRARLADASASLEVYVRKVTQYDAALAQADLPRLA